MAERVIMPKAGMAMETGTIVAWLKAVGDAVAYGEPLLEIETDKTTMQVESMSGGYLLKKLYDEGDEVPVTTTIGYIGTMGEALPADAPIAPSAPAQPVTHAAPSTAAAAAPRERVPGTLRATPAARRLAREQGIRLEDRNTGEILRARDLIAQADAAGAPAIKATPLAKRVAQMQGTNIEEISGSGHGGKVFSRDLPAPNAQASRKVPLSGMRKTIARRMLQSHTEIPPVTLHAQADVTELMRLRAKINAAGAGAWKVSVNDLVLRACAIALQEFPNINASYTPEGVLQHESVNIGVAVAREEGLVVPVLTDAPRYPIRALSEKTKELAQAAREDTLPPDAYTGGTFTVSNLGMYGISSFTPIINLPEACILGVCAISEQLALVEGSVVARSKMGLSLTFDHRCIDGAGGAKFLQRIVALLENPLELCIG